MPSIWTHILFCEDVLDTVTGPLPFSRNETFMKLGALGPDLFYFYNFWPWISEEETDHEIGRILQYKQCDDFMTDLIKTAKKENSKVRAYVFGFVTHCLLYKHIRPYIEYHTDYKGHHPQQFEVNIDTLMMKRYHNLKTWKAPVHKEIDIGMKLNKEISHLLGGLIDKHYPEIANDTSAYARKSYRDMKFALRLYSDPLRWKNKLFPTFVSAHSHQPIENDIDYLNLNKSTWYNTDTKKSADKSFIELFEAARAQGLEIMPAILNYWDGENNAEKVFHYSGMLASYTDMDQKGPATH